MRIRFRAPVGVTVLALWAISATGAEPPALIRGPYLQMLSENSVVLVWRTQGPIQPVVKFGHGPGRLTQEVEATSVVVRKSADVAGDGDLRLHSAPPDTYQYEARVGGLRAGATYYYAVYHGTELLAGADNEHFFKTAPMTGQPSPLFFWVLGCSGTGDSNARRVFQTARQYAERQSRPLDFFLHLGDQAYYDGSDSQFQERFFDMYQTALRHTVCWPTMGNHEGFTSQSQTRIGPYFDAFVLPTRGESGGLASGREDYYSFDYGSVHFVCLNSADADRGPSGDMARWLKEDLAQNRSDWLIAFWHHPPYSRGTHDSDAETEMIEMRQNIMPMLEEAGVDLVLNAHSHLYERSMLFDGAYETPTTAENKVLNDGDGDPQGDGAYVKRAGLYPHQGTIEVVAGNGGATLFRRGEFPLMIRSLVEHGSLFCAMENNELLAVMVNADGEVRDRFVIRKEGYVPARRIAHPWQPLGPVMQPDIPLFQDRLAVTLTSRTHWDDEEIHFTRDGGEPTRDSPRYTAPLVLTNDATIRARAFPATGGRSTPITSADYLLFRGVLRPPLPDESDLRPGLRFSYYEGEWRRLPDFSALPIVKIGVATNINLDARQQDDDFGFAFAGEIEAPRDGIYAFYLNSDDGSRLLLGDQVVVDADGAHVAQEKPGYIGLKAGRHPFQLLYFEAAGAEILDVQWQGPGLPKQPIPAAALWHSAQAIH